MERDAESRRDDNQRAGDERHEEAIAPVRPGLGAQRPAGPGDGERRRRGGAAPLLAGGALVLLSAAAAGVFFVLPQWIASPSPGAESEVVFEPVPVETAPALSEEEIEALTERADELLADLLAQQQRLEDLSPEAWAGEDWARYGSLGRAGDDAYLDEAFQDAVDAYSDALALGETLLERSARIIDGSLEAGRQALRAGDAELAREQFELVLTIDPDHGAAAAGAERARRLPEVLEHVREAESLRQQGRLEEAADAYRAALDIDADWTPARRGLEDVEQRIAAARFDALMSEGMRLLSEERWDDAERAFEDALGVRPGSDEARDGIAQAEQGRRLDAIALTEARALAFERRELWEQAIEQYESALAIDDSLAFARDGLERARARADLHAKLAHLIENPNLLLGDDVLAGARRLLEEAADVADSVGEGRSTARLQGQIDRLGELVELASTPVPVELRSDEMTEVTVYRVGELGRFASKELELRPGRYTVIGSRDGYRDVRETFTVLPGRELEPIRVVCMEPI